MTVMQKGRIHMIGIGGIGMSALARLYRSRGFQVGGSDISRSEITDALRKEGVRIFIGQHKAANVAGSVGKVIHTAAARPDNPELAAAKRRRIPIKTYAGALGELSRDYRLIAIAGSHGKSTTTALTALTLIYGKLDPTVVIGTKLRQFKNSNFRPGRSKWLVIEADEYRASFHNYRPEVAVVTNIDREHLDYYRTTAKVEAAFLKFLSRIRAGGTAVLNRDDERTRRIGRKLARSRKDVRIIWYSLRDAAAVKIRKLIRIPGRHNVSNALAALQVASALRIPRSARYRAIASYRGAWRRFDYQGKLSFQGASGQVSAKVFADYAHHPTEIKATLQAAREKFPKSRIWCIFQPHHYERTRTLFKEFSRAFKDCDAAILLDIYEVAGREHRRKDDLINSEHLAKAITRRGTPALYLNNPRRLKPFLKRWLKEGDLVLMMGAGDIWEETKKLIGRKA